LIDFLAKKEFPVNLYLCNFRQYRKKFGDKGSFTASGIRAGKLISHPRIILQFLPKLSE